MIDWLNMSPSQKLRYYFIKIQSKPIDVRVLDNPYQRYAVWLGGSMLAKTPGFQSMYHTR